ncbi:MAG: imidazole glycerol phosphate synthase subunit HisH [Arenimonas sp.]
MNAPVTLIDAGGANLGSVRYALERLGAEVRMARDADEFAGCARAILPGVGAAPAAMALLQARGLVGALRASNAPLLGICLGMQLLFDSSAEGDVACLGLLEGRVDRMAPAPGLRVPHMGWNSLQPLRPDPLLDGLADVDQVYFVHGYAAPVTPDCIARARHGRDFAAVVRRGCVFGMQFHPERSAGVGARLLGNFLQESAP